MMWKSCAVKRDVYPKEIHVWSKSIRGISCYALKIPDVYIRCYMIDKKYTSMVQFEQQMFQGVYFTLSLSNKRL